ncbi:uncharacterized protein BDZ99DRAFT_463483 [Mytilinidion resinicola]|uniref:Mitochondrial export translocase Oxa2 n=1 Tax=Mytilinidion resinicola TaxID=574789 RepID=A0A6A6YNX4_9PEZI|nr:uncharacterized protein BDZ99DRAFT_463483 [Mytilinidion resinicola]KAF2809714.1 hypothetical protein BDZ99DRAFT_463483 [Mytilinidion resinicola]
MHPSLPQSLLSGPSNIRPVTSMLTCRTAVRPSCHLLKSPQHLLRRPRQRAFHPSSPCHGPLVDLLTSDAHLLYNGMHSLGLPWACAIPASALFVRVFILSPISYWALKAKQRRADVQPLASAATAIALRNLQTVAARQERKNVTILYDQIRKWQQNVVHGQQKRWRISLGYSFIPIITQLPVFLIMAEALRQKLGIGNGLLGMVTNGIANILSAIGNAVNGTRDSLTGAPISTEDTSVIQSGEIATSVEVSQYLEPSLADGGILWFPDLTVADPLHCLPFVISGLTFYNIWSGSRDVESRMTRPLLVLAVCMGPILWDAPAALLLYWIGSNVSASVANKALERKWPMRVAPKACKRPLWIPRRKFNLHK